MAPEKRRTSARLREPAPKRQATIKSPLAEKPAPNPPAKRKQPSPEPVQDPEQLLPTKLTDGPALPTLPKDYVSARPDAQWQSIAESGVFAAALLKSRQRWVSGCFFEKYWSKSTYKKKKDSTEADKAQAKDPRPPMTKVGTCKLIVEPHIFDITLFVVRETNPQNQSPVERQFVQYGPTSPAILPNTPQAQYASGSHTPLSTNKTPLQPATHQSSAKPLPTSTPVSRPPSTPLQSANPTPKPLPTVAPTIKQTSAQSRNKASTPQNSTPSRPPQPHNQPAPPSEPAKPASQTTDPVIHMLAQRASTDNALKQVMKIVASGQATQPQLEYFQRHIDELTAIVNARREEERRTAANTTPAHRPLPTTTPTTQHASANNRPVQHVGTYQQPHNQYHSVQRFGTPIAAARPSPQGYNTNHNLARSRPFVAAPQHVLIEFSINSTDRFLFPKNSILEYLPGGGGMLVSFLVVKKHSELLDSDSMEAKKQSKAKKAEEPAKDVDPKLQSKGGVKASESSTNSVSKEELEKEFYQPVTIRLEMPSDAGVFNVISRVVAQPSEVSKHMVSIAERCERASPVRLALRLPKEKLEPQTI
jgi:hypothetical protein